MACRRWEQRVAARTAAPISVTLPQHSRMERTDQKSQALSNQPPELAIPMGAGVA
jgi:hypothetical protein